MSIKTFGSEKEEQQDCEVVKVAMKTMDGAPESIALHCSSDL